MLKNNNFEFDMWHDFNKEIIYRTNIINRVCNILVQNFYLIHIYDFPMTPYRPFPMGDF